MLVVERHWTSGSEEMVRLCGLSRDLYNRANFLMRRSWFARERQPGIGQLVEAVRGLDCFKSLHNTKTAKQTLFMLLADWGTFKKTLGVYGRHPEKFRRRPKPPGYKEKLAQVAFYRETIKHGQGKYKARSGVITPTNDLFTITSRRDYQQVVVTPKAFGFVIEVKYERPIEKEGQPKLKKGRMCFVDPGVNNLMAITSDQTRPVLVNGRPLKSFNQWLNKKPTSKRRQVKRYWRVENYLHHAANVLVTYCVENQIGTVVIGRNDGWKTEVNIGHRNNQNLCFIPHDKLWQKIEYRAKLIGLEIRYQEEAYTSQASFLDRDPLPEYAKGLKPPAFSGKRIKRGLYTSAAGIVVNADANGSANIGRKVIGNDEELLLRLDRSLAARPVAINPLRPSAYNGGHRSVDLLEPAIISLPKFA